MCGACEWCVCGVCVCVRVHLYIQHTHTHTSGYLYEPAKGGCDISIAVSLARSARALPVTCVVVAHDVDLQYLRQDFEVLED